MYIYIYIYMSSDHYRELDEKTLYNLILDAIFLNLFGLS